MLDGRFGDRRHAGEPIGPSDLNDPDPRIEHAVDDLGSIARRFYVHGHRAKDRDQPLVELVERREEVEDPLVKPQTRCSQADAERFDEAPSAQGACGVRALQWASGSAASARPNVGPCPSLPDRSESSSETGRRARYLRRA